ncbi:hypothetical protein YC2023_105257 [Brassica napus]
MEEIKVENVGNECRVRGEGLVHKFHPVSAIINDSLRITKEAAEKAFRDAENEPASQFAAIDRQIRSLRAGVRCIRVPVRRPRGADQQRLVLSAAATYVWNIQGQLFPPLRAKPGSTIKKKNRGQNRSQSSVHVASDRSNHFSLQPSPLALQRFEDPYRKNRNKYNTGLRPIPSPSRPIKAQSPKRYPTDALIQHSATSELSAAQTITN